MKLAMLVAAIAIAITPLTAQAQASEPSTYAEDAAAFAAVWEAGVDATYFTDGAFIVADQASGTHYYGCESGKACDVTAFTADGWEEDAYIFLPLVRDGIFSSYAEDGTWLVQIEGHRYVGCQEARPCDNTVMPPIPPVETTLYLPLIANG